MSNPMLPVAARGGEDDHELCAGGGPPIELASRTLRWCADGHSWIDHLDGNVTPSWGYGGTRVAVPNPRRCPEPLPRADGRRHRCARCGRSIRSTLALIASRCDHTPAQRCVISTEHGCSKPALGAGHRWSECNWPFPAEDDWRLWWVARELDPPRLCWLIGTVSVRWRSTFDALDLHRGERFDIDGADQTIRWVITRARHEELPAAMRTQWPTRADGRPVVARFANVAELPDLRWLARRIDGTVPPAQLTLLLP